MCNNATQIQLIQSGLTSARGTYACSRMVTSKGQTVPGWQQAAEP